LSAKVLLFVLRSLRCSGQNVRTRTRSNIHCATDLVSQDVEFSVVFNHKCPNVPSLNLVKRIIIYMKKLLDSDWLWSSGVQL